MSQHKIMTRRVLCDSTYVLRLERNGLSFTPGQHINAGLNKEDNRPYTIYSGIDDDFIEILIKEVQNGNVSRKLKLMEPGEEVYVEPPSGGFTLEKELSDETPFLFIGSGTGISPYHSFVKSYRKLNYRIIHGIRYSHESYERDLYEDRYLCCTSRDDKGDFRGRVTHYLKGNGLPREAHYFLCGNYAMIDDVYDLLISKGVDKKHIKTEGYF